MRFIRSTWLTLWRGGVRWRGQPLPACPSFGSTCARVTLWLRSLRTSAQCKRAVREVILRSTRPSPHATPMSCRSNRYLTGRACSNRKTPFLLAVTMSSRPSPLKSATTNWVPMPLWSSISRGVKRDLAVGAAAGLEPVEPGGLVGAGLAPAVRPEPLAGDQVLQAVAVDVGGDQGVRLGDEVGEEVVLGEGGRAVLRRRPARTTRCRTGGPSWRSTSALPSWFTS